MYKLALPLVLLAIVVAASLVTDRPLPPADFTFVNRNVTTLDPQRMSWMQDLRVARLLFEGLVANDVFTHGQDIVPAVAERWEVSQDGKVYTFYLRDNARWSNGSPVRAQDFVYSWRRAILPDTAADYAKLFTYIRGVPEFFDWRQEALERFSRDRAEGRTTESAQQLWERTLEAFHEMVGLEALDDRTLRVELEKPTPYFLDLCAFAVLYPVYEPLVSRYESIDGATGRLRIQSGWTKPDRIISNGPFTLSVWRYKRDMRLEANEQYWNKDSLAIGSIQIPSIEDGNATVLAFRTGAVDFCPDVTAPYRADMLAAKDEFYLEHAEEVARLRALGLDPFQVDRHLPPDPRKHIHAVPAFATYFYNFNCLPTLPDGRDNPFHDPRVRRAFAMAVDKESVVRDVRRSGEPVARTLVPPGSVAGYEPPAGLDCISDGRTPAQRDAIAARARALLAEAGYSDPSRFPTVTLLFNKDAGHDLIAQALARNWEQHLGVPVGLQQKELRVFRDDLNNANFITSRSGWYGDYGDPTTFLELNRTGDGNNYRKYSNPEYDALLDAAQDETDPQRRMEILREAERIVMEEDLPMVPLFHYVSVYLFDPDRVSGINPHPRSNQNLFLVEILDGKDPDRARQLPPRPPSETPMGGNGNTGTSRPRRGRGGTALIRGYTRPAAPRIRLHDKGRVWPG